MPARSAAGNTPTAAEKRADQRPGHADKSLLVARLACSAAVSTRRDVAPGQDREQLPVAPQVFPVLLLDPVRLEHQPLVGGVAGAGGAAGAGGRASGSWWGGAAGREGTGGAWGCWGAAASGFVPAGKAHGSGGSQLPSPVGHLPESVQPVQIPARLPIRGGGRRCE
jgi:hypothetical protein